jgi:thiol-disulfide isomerase/thioredoxin
MARQYSMALTGIQIDAIYHTSVVMGGVEYFFGQGIHRKVPGSTHHGRPIKVVKMGQTHLPDEVIQEYIQSLESIYTPESYDLFLHNCNNFSQDLAMFLVGKDIPEEIRNLPEAFLRTPIGQMLRGQIDQSMRQMTQAPDAASGRSIPQTKAPTALNGSAPKPNGVAPPQLKAGPAVFANGTDQPYVPGHVHNITSTSDLDRLLRAADSSCAVIFFTSATCPPCKIVYPAYDELAAEAGNKATLIKVDTSVAYDVARRYQIRATPTFITFLKGKKDQEWSGAHEARLKGNVRLLVQMANPQHAHMKLRLPSFQSRIQKPTMYTRTPPLDKLMTKLGPAGQDKAIQDLVAYIRIRDKEGLANASIPNLHAISDWIPSELVHIPIDVHFVIIDLIRIASTDPRISSYLVAEPSNLILEELICSTRDYSTVPYNLQVVSLQLACNLFSSTILHDQLLDPSNTLRAKIENLASTSLLATHHNARSLAAALVFNLAAYDHNERLNNQPDSINLSSMPDLEAALVEAVVNESENKETLHALLMALGLLLFAAPPESSIWDLCSAMDVRENLKQKSRIEVFKGEVLIKEVGEELLGKGSPPW